MKWERDTWSVRMKFFIHGHSWSFENALKISRPVTNCQNSTVISYITKVDSLKFIQADYSILNT